MQHLTSLYIKRDLRLRGDDNNSFEEMTKTVRGVDNKSITRNRYINLINKSYSTVIVFDASIPERSVNSAKNA